MTTAFVLSGGVSLAAVQVGMLGALAARGVAPDLLVGTSAGALNAAFLAGHGTGDEGVEELASIWRSLRTWQLFRPDPLRAVGAVVGSGTAVFGDHGVRRLIEGHMTFADLADAPIRVQVVATDLLSGQEVALGSGPAVEAILASSAFPGLLPPVQWDGRTLVDGGLADNTAISQAVAAGADEVYVLPCGYPCALTEPPRTALGTVAQAWALLVHQRLLHDIDLYAEQIDLVVLPPPCPLTVNPLDFRHADELIRRAHLESLEFLAIDGGRRSDPGVEVALHTHPSAPPAPDPSA